MGQSAYIRLVKESGRQDIQLDDIKELLLEYVDQTGKTGAQLGWNYDDFAFPYDIKTRPDGEGKWFYLEGRDPSYRRIVFGVGRSANAEAAEAAYIQVFLPEDSTHGDKAKANELCKWISRKLNAELQMFNGRVIRHHLYK